MIEFGLMSIANSIFCAKFAQKQGTCFSLVVDRRQYLITARHLADNLTCDAAGKYGLRIFHEKQWKLLPVALVGHSPEPADISVFVADVMLVPSMLKAVPPGFVYGHDAFFFGFPYVEDSGIICDPNLPTPFIKKGIFSYVAADGRLFIDGHNNPGFSGGPVVSHNINLKTRKNESPFYNFAGVVSAYRATSKAVKEYGKDSSSLSFDENAGIVVAYSISFALDLIKANPIGFPVKYGA